MLPFVGNSWNALLFESLPSKTSRCVVFLLFFPSCFSFVFFVRRAVFVAILHNCSTFEFICSECLLCEQPQTSQRFIRRCNSHVCKSECAMHCTHTATLTQVFVIWGVLFIFQTAQSVSQICTRTCTFYLLTSLRR